MRLRHALSTGLRVAAVASATAMLAAVCSSASSGSGSGGGGGSHPLVGVDYPRSDSDFWNAYIKYVRRWPASWV